MSKSKNRQRKYRYRGRNAQRFFYDHPELWGLLIGLAVALLAVVTVILNT